MNLRTASLLLTLVIGFRALPAQAQGPGGPPQNSLANQVAALTAKVATLEEQVAKLQGKNITAADLVGTYALVGFSVNLTGGFPAEIRSDVIVGTVTLNADFTASVSVTASGYRLTQGTPWLLGTTAAGNNASLTWTYANGIVTFSNGNRVTVTAGGLAVSAASFNLDTSTGVTDITIVTRLLQ